MEQKVSFCLNDIVEDKNNREYMLKISSDSWELNILLSKAELLKIPDVINARWEDRTCLKLGECLGSPTWWTLEDKEFSILVGTDDESWDFGVTMPSLVLEDLFNEIDVNENRRITGK